MLETPAPWERQPTDTPKSFTAFTHYRDLGPQRSIARAAQLYGRHPQLLREWSARYNWVARVEAWDLEQDRLKREAAAAEVEAMGRRHAQQAAAAQQAALAPITALLRRIQRDPEVMADKMFLSELLDVAMAAARTLPGLQNAERLARGEPTDITINREISVALTATDDTGHILDVVRALNEAGIRIPLDTPQPLEVDEDAPGIIETVEVEQ